MAAMAEFARLPNRQKALVFVVIGLGVGALYWQFVFKSLKNDLAEAESQHDSAVAQSRKLDQDIKEFNELKPTVNRLKAQIDQNEKALPSESELPAFFETLNRKVTESGVQVNRSTQQPEEPVDAFIKVPVTFEIQGTFMQIKKFFASLVPKKKHPGQTDQPGDASVEERERIVSIENLSLFEPTQKNSELVMTATFTAMTYRQEVKAEPAAKTPAPAGANAPAGTKPLPPAATPQGAKVRANDAMQKSETRSAGSAERLKGGL
jgi:Tfp pilus assembly protein PilO